MPGQCGCGCRCGRGGPKEQEIRTQAPEKAAVRDDRTVEERLTAIEDLLKRLAERA
jgi:hypothetical protein